MMVQDRTCDLLGVNEWQGGRCWSLVQVVSLRWSHEVGPGRRGCCTCLLYCSRVAGSPPWLPAWCCDGVRTLSAVRLKSLVARAMGHDARSRLSAPADGVVEDAVRLEPLTKTDVAPAVQLVVRVLRVRPDDRAEQFASDITDDRAQMFVAKANGQVVAYC